MGEVAESDMSTITSRFSPHNPPQSPISMSSVPQVAVESPTLYAVLVDSRDVCPTADRVMPLLHQAYEKS